MLKNFLLYIKEFLKLFYSPYRSRQKSAKKRLRTKYAQYYYKYRVEDDLVLYESSYGRGMTCNPYAIFKAFMHDEIFSHYRHVWVLEDLKEHQPLLKEFQQFSNVIFVERETDEYFKYLVSAKYLINNTSFSSYFAKKKDQVYINTWHSITVKKLGFDMPDGKLATGNMLRNLLAADYIISANQFTTKIFKTAFKLDGLYEGKIIENGYPRNDLLLQTSRADVVKKLQAAGVRVDEKKKIILYAPTWRGNNFFQPDYSIAEYLQVLESLQQGIHSADYQVLIKPHPAVAKHLPKKYQKNTVFIPAAFDTNELLAAVDVLISDYSSIFFDFMLTNRPVLFYIPDLEEYKTKRGVYFKIDELPGPASERISDIIYWLNHIDEVQTQYKEIYQKTKAWVYPYDDGHAAAKVLDIVFKGQEHKYNIINGLRQNKKKLLIYASRLKTNGVTFSLLSLLNHLDYTKFDVSLIATNIKKADVKENIKKVPAEVRVFARNGTYSATLWEDIRAHIVRRYGLRSWLLKKIFPAQLFMREFQRCFGDSRFDYVIDFSGYGPFFVYLIMQAEGAKRYIWQHSDLWRDQARMVAGKERTYFQRRTGIQAVFSLYPYFDKIVACSKSVMEINRNNLATPKTYHKFTYATNMVDFKRVLYGLQKQADLEIYAAPYMVRPQISDNGAMVLGSLIKLPASDTINFVNMGRLSPEKNQENLIKAFAKLYEEHKNCRLYIIGEGDLQLKLEELINKLSLTEAVFLLGTMSNPFPFLRSCQCFVFPSYYEGYSVSLLEVRLVGLPILVADYPSVGDVLMESGQLLIKQDVDSIYQGMKAFLAGKVPANYHFDPQVYNQHCYEEFERLFA
ncbi:MAG: glycosyltransferase [Firmicutes bacterium]|nr:glycosyltransferase [Bacillota bacterium]